MAADSDDDHRLRLALLAAVVVVARAAFAFDREFFNLSPDEPSFVGVARWLSGTGNWHMFDSSTTRPGYSFLLAPAFWLMDSSSVIRFALLLNAAIGGVAAVWLAKLLTRISTVDHRTAILSAGLIALTPASLSASAHAWSEPLVTLVVIAVIWHLIELVGGRATAAFSAVAWAAAGTLVHGRLIPLVVSTVAVVSIVVVRRRDAKLAFAAFAVALSGWAMAEAISRMVVARVWDDPLEANSAGAVVDRIDDVGAIARSAIGQGWYLLASTLTITAIGVVNCVRSLRGRESIVRHRHHAAIVLGTTLPLIALSMIFVSGRDRPDQAIYGRYNDAVIWTILGIGVAWAIDRLTRTDLRDAVRTVVPGVVTMMALALVLQYQSGSSLSRSWGISAMIAGIVPLSPSRGAVPVAGVTLVALAVGLAVAVIARLTRTKVWIPAVLTCCVLLAGGVRLHTASVERRDGGMDSSRSVAAVREIVPRGEVIGVRVVPDWLGPSVPQAQQLAYALYYSWELEEYELRKDFGDDDVGPYVIAPTNDPLFLAADAPVLWRDPYADMALWYETAP